MPVSRFSRIDILSFTAMLFWAGMFLSAYEALCAQELVQLQVIGRAQREFPVPKKPPTSGPGSLPSTFDPDEATFPGSGSPDKPGASELKAAQQIVKLLTRYERVRESTSSLRGKPYQPENHDGKTLLVMDTIEYNVMPRGPSNGDRFLIAKLHVINQTAEPVTIDRGKVQLKLAGEAAVGQSEINESILNYSFDIGNNQSQSFSTVKRPEKQTIPAGRAGWIWIYFADLGLGTNLPDAEILVELNGQQHALDLKSQVYGQMHVTRTDIGPEECLALIEIGGRFNIAALSVLAEIFDNLIEQKIVRAVVVWNKNAPRVDSSITHHLYQYAANAGRANRNFGRNSRYPVLNEAMREVHLANHPGSSYSSGNAPRVMHDEPVAAVSAALWSALSVLPKDQLIEQIRHGHKWVRPAALSAGAAQLGAEELPLVLEYSRDTEDPMLQMAAVYALRQFGDEAAVQRLLELAESDHKQLTPQAIAGLSQSRYQSGRTALRNLLQTAEPQKRTQLLRVIAEHPAAAFADLYYESATDPESPLRVESLQALNAVGHEELIPLLKTCLDDPAQSVRNAAFEIILSRREPELEPLLEARVLERLEAGELSTNIQNYLRYTKHPAAIPMLMKRLQEKRKDRNERQQLISLLSQIGDQRIGPLLVELYPDLEEYEKRNVLETLSEIQSPEFMKFAKAGLVSKDSSLVSASIEALSKHDSLEAEAILIDGFDRLKNESYYGNLAGVLSQIGSEEAEAKLREGRKSLNSQKRIASINGLLSLQQRKPGYQYVYQANYQMRNKKWKEALQYINTSIEIDDSLAVAHAVKGTILLRMKKIEEADKSFARAVKLDEVTSEAVVGRMRVKALQKNIKEAIADFRKVQAEFARDNIFEYHAGLLFADAATVAGQVNQNETENKPYSNRQIQAWKSESLSWLSDSIRHGFNDSRLIRSAPELKPLEKHPQFQKAMSGQLPERKIPQPKPKADEAPAEGAAAAAGDAVIIQVNGTAPEGPVIIQPVVIDLPPPPR